AAVVSRYFVMQQFYVGVGPNSEVVIYRGVDGSILGFDLHEVAQGSCPPGASLCEPLRVSDLQQRARNAVSAGVPRASMSAAQEYIDTLRLENVLDYCEPAGKGQNGEAGGAAGRGGLGAGADTSGDSSGSDAPSSSASAQPSEGASGQSGEHSGEIGRASWRGGA